MLITGSTDKGIKRQVNQDSFATGKIAGGCFAVVCDGMGGQRGGEVASRLACDIIAEAISRDFSSKTEGGARDLWIQGALQSAAKSANKAVFDLGESDASLSGMGTTLVAAVITDGCAYILHAGDSRAYLIHGGEVSQLTTDHTMVQLLLDRGDITLSESRSHPQRHYITRALGVGAELDFSFCSQELSGGDALLICTDGLYNFINAGEFQNLVLRSLKERRTDALIEAAIKGGGGDNITAVLIGCVTEEAAFI